MITVAEIRTALLASRWRGKQRVQDVAARLHCELDEVRRVARTLTKKLSKKLPKKLSKQASKKTSKNHRRRTV